MAGLSPSLGPEVEELVSRTWKVGGPWHDEYSRPKARHGGMWELRGKRGSLGSRSGNSS